MGVWIETVSEKDGEKRFMSLPAWECGLKLCLEDISVIIKGSLPAWECGLKRAFPPGYDSLFLVTPRVGVWIETFFSLINSRSSDGHSPRGSVD